MSSEQLTRTTLWISAPFNLGAAALFAFPSSSLGRALGMPAEVPALYAALVALFVALFGLVYAWTAAQPVLVRPLVVLGAVGKFGAFAIALALFLAGSVQASTVAVACGDLALALIWSRWLLESRAD
jgi:hypothetical protein